MLLAAFTLEDLLKGNLVETAKGALNKSGRFRYDRHDLLDLAGKANIALSEQETDLVERLDVYLKWAGRYPIPLVYDDLLPRTLPSGGFSVQTYGSSADRGIWRALVQRIQA